MEAGNIQDLLNNAICEMMRREDVVFINAVKENAYPPIKEPITKGKLKWRGIKLIVKDTPMGKKKWLEQRGKVISPEVFNAYF